MLICSRKLIDKWVIDSEVLKMFLFSLQAFVLSCELFILFIESHFFSVWIKEKHQHNKTWQILQKYRKLLKAEAELLIVILVFALFSGKPLTVTFVYWPCGSCHWPKPGNWWDISTFALSYFHFCQRSFKNRCETLGKMAKTAELPLSS